MPNNAVVIDVKPVNQSVVDIKSSNLQVSDPTTVYRLPPIMRTIPAGQWIPFAGLTYPNSITITTGGGVRP